MDVKLRHGEKVLVPEGAVIFHRGFVDDSLNPHEVVEMLLEDREVTVAYHRTGQFFADIDCICAFAINPHVSRCVVDIATVRRASA